MAHNTWEEWLAHQRSDSSMTVKKIHLEQVRGWGMQDNDTRFGRPDAKFFSHVGVQVSVPKPGQREVMSWDQPMCEEVGEGALVLVKAVGEEKYLVSAKAEPGNDADGCVLLAPTLQASMSNILQAHGGARPPRADLVASNTSWWTIFKDGGKFYHKVNHAVMIELDGLEPLQNERWFTRDELRQAMFKGECNEHLLELLAFAFV